MSESAHRSRILIIDDQRLLADSLCVTLRLEGFDPVVAALADPEGLLELVRRDPPDLVLLDLDLRGAIGDGTVLVGPFVSAGAAVLVLTGTTDPLWRAAAIEQGACGFVDKETPFDDLVTIVMAAARGEPVLGPGERARMLADLSDHRARRRVVLAPFERLTPREQQVLRALAHGMTVPSIARDWVVSEATVRSQVHAVLSKLSVRSQLEAVASASRAGWL